MNAPLRLDKPPPGQALHDGSAEILLGMPHLAFNGISETWLLKELGHRHWLMLAHVAGRSVPDFRDSRNSPVYAAFRSVEITNARFEQARENDVLHVSSALSRISRTQMISRHTLSIGAEAVGAVTLTSVFVHRRAGPSNHTIARIEIDGLPPLDPRLGQAIPAPAPRLEPSGPLELCPFTPCPSQDFNGAGFLYFTSFLSFVDRAEWTVRPSAAKSGLLRQRRIDYFGNIDPGESIVVALARPQIRNDTSCFECRIERASDGVLLANVHTERLMEPLTSTPGLSKDTRRPLHSSAQHRDSGEGAIFCR